MPTMIRYPLVAATGAAALVLALSGCAGGSDKPAAKPSPSDTVVSAEEGGPITALPSCEAPPKAGSKAPAGLFVPPGTVITKVTPADKSTRIEAYVELTPVKVERFYKHAKGVEIRQIENEVTESEGLIEVGGYQQSFRAKATCATGSKLWIVLAPEPS
jgi:hypothetical protein